MSDAVFELRRTRRNIQEVANNLRAAARAMEPLVSLHDMTARTRRDTLLIAAADVEELLGGRRWDEEPS